VEEAKAMGTPMILSSLRVHREQSHDALFFDPALPGQLASILDNFSRAGPDERLSMSISAAQRASANVKLFADEFVKLMALRVKHK
jgi:hypothetical protein